MKGRYVLATAALLLLLQAGGSTVCQLEAGEDACEDSAAGSCPSCCSACSCCPHAAPLAVVPAFSMGLARELAPAPAEGSVVEPDPADILHVPKSAAA